MTRILVTGADGMLGRELVPVLSGQASVTAMGRSRLDITNTARLGLAVAGFDLVINTAAWTDVDGAEIEEEAATAVNGHAVAALARCCVNAGSRLIQISTDHVFAGTATTPYPEYAPPRPVNAYGRSKLVGEQAVRRFLPETGYVLRTAWLYGGHKPHFVATMLRLAAERATVEVPADQYGQPTWAGALAVQITALAAAAVRGQAPAGIYHGTATGQTTRYDFARAVFAGAGLDPARVRPTTTAQVPRPARRPRYAVLGHDRWSLAGIALQPAWRTQLTDYLARVAPGSTSTDVQNWTGRVGTNAR